MTHYTFYPFAAAFNSVEHPQSKFMSTIYVRKVLRKKEMKENKRKERKMSLNDKAQMPLSCVGKF